MFTIDLVTLFPELFAPFVGLSIVGRAVEAGLVDVRYHHLLDELTEGERADDAPFGGGPGMVLRIEPIARVLDRIAREAPGGEIPAVAFMDATIRLLPGVLRSESLQDESFTGGVLDYPSFTRPATFRGIDVPRVLLSGDHAKIAQWRREQSRLRTAARRRDLLDDALQGPRRP